MATSSIPFGQLLECEVIARGTVMGGTSRGKVYSYNSRPRVLRRSLYPDRYDGS